MSKFSIEIDETELNEIEDIYNSNIEVDVTLEDGFPLKRIVGTPSNLQYLMEKDKENFYGPGIPWIIVQKLTKEIITEAIEAYAEEDDAYWLKYYHFATEIDIAVFNQLQARQIKESEQFKLLDSLDDLRAKINKLDNLDKSKKSDLVASLNKLYEYDLIGPPGLPVDPTTTRGGFIGGASGTFLSGFACAMLLIVGGILINWIHI